MRCIRIRSKYVLSLIALTAIGMQAATTQAQDRDHRQVLRAELSPSNEIPTKFSAGNGDFHGELNEDGSLSFQLSFSDLSSPATQAHIHFGATKTNGGVMVFLCGGPKPACPASGFISGTITASDVSVLPANNADSVIPQGVQPGNFGALVEAIRKGDTYVNVHSTDFPTGEIRGHVKLPHEEEHKDQ
jgi:hypothetical protein